jgi:hypothetical protein
MREADERFAERLAEDLERYLGPEIVLDRLEFGDVEYGHAGVRATCTFDGRTEVLESDGETRLEAYNGLVVQAAELRLGVAIRHLGPNLLVGVAAAWEAGLIPEHRS